MPRLLVDGMQIESSVEDRVLRTAPNRPPDWWVEFEHGAVGEGLDGVAWTGDVRYEGEPWARFGRLGGKHVVLLEGAASVTADRALSTATVRHDPGAGVSERLASAYDAAALRRTSPYLASLSGRLVLHASAVHFQMAALFLGEAGAGKSTLAFAMACGRAQHLADDHVTVDVSNDGMGVAHASFPLASVTRATERAFGTVGWDSGTGEVMEKILVPVPTKHRPAWAPVQNLAFLERGARLSTRPMKPADAVARLLKEAVFVADPADREAHTARLDACARLVAAAPPITLVVPDGIDRLRSVLHEIAELWGGLPPPAPP